MSLTNKYQACIFDLDGTLTDTLEDLKNSVNFAMRSIGRPERTADEVRRFVGNGMEKLIKRSVGADCGEADIIKATEHFKNHYAEHLSDNTAPYDGIIPLLDSLSERNIKTAVISNKDDSAVKKIVSGFFGERILFSQGKRNDIPPKPHPQALFNMIERLGCDRTQVIYIGDSDVDVETAHNAGVECIGVTWGFRDRELLVKSGADFIVDTPAEISEIIK